MNIDFSARPGFSAYVLLLMFSGVIMLGLSSPAIKRSTRGLRLLNGLFGAGFVIYGFYLAFIFNGGTYIIFFKAFILPVLLIVNTVRSAVRTNRAMPANRMPAQIPTSAQTPTPAPAPPWPAAPAAAPAPVRDDAVPPQY